MGGTMTSRTDVAAIIDHTLLKPEATPADVAALVAEAKDLGVLAICVSPSMLPIADPGELVVATVVGFPSGQVKPEIKAAEAKRAVADGAAEVDMVINIGSAVAGDFDAVEADIRGVVEASGRSLRSEEHTSELQSRGHLVCRLLLETKQRKRRTRR